MERLNKRHRFIPNHCNSVQWLKWSLMNILYVCVLTLEYPTMPPDVWICFILNLFTKVTIKTSSCQNRDLIYSCTQPFLYLPNQWTAWMTVRNPFCTPTSQLRPINTDVPNLPIFGIPDSRVISTRHQDGSHGRCLQSWPNSTWHQMAWPLQGNGWGKNRGTKANNVPQAFQSLK